MPGMKCESTIEMEPPVESTNNSVKMPMGMLGFEQMKDYSLLANPAEEPFAWLQARGNSSVTFVVVNPFIAVPDYQPDIPEADAEFLGLKDENDALLLNIVTLHGSGHATVNLKGPIVINRRTHIGKQVVIANATDYSVQHPLPVAVAAA
jgi:flagellar assembly factor FliW